MVGTQVCPNHVHDKITRREGVLELNIEALFKFILFGSKDLFIYFCFLFFETEKNRRLEKNTGYLPAVLVYGQKLNLGSLLLMLQLPWCCGSLHHQCPD